MTTTWGVIVTAALFAAFAAYGALAVRHVRRNPPPPRRPPALLAMTRRRWIALGLLLTIYAVYSGFLISERLDWWAVGYVVAPAPSLALALWTSIKAHRTSKRRLA